MFVGKLVDYQTAAGEGRRLREAPQGPAPTAASQPPEAETILETVAMMELVHLALVR